MVCAQARALLGLSIFFFFQAEDGIRDYKVTGVQTCALPISKRTAAQSEKLAAYFRSITPLLDATRAQLAANQKSLDEYLKTVPRSMISVSEIGRASCRERV